MSKISYGDYPKCCGTCRYLENVDKSQDGGECAITGTFQKFNKTCIADF